MADEEVEGKVEAGKGKSKLPLIIAGLVLIVAVLAMMLVFAGNEDGPKNEIKPVAEYAVKERMYQLKDGSYLRLAFSIVVDADKVEVVKEVLEAQSPGRLPDGIHLLLGNKTRNDLINGAHKREAFARELKKMLEEQVFSNYNKMQKSSADQIEVRKILLGEYVTQSG
jgi:flagellar basal body-associated protein FliL